MPWGRGPAWVPYSRPAGSWSRPWRFPPGRPAQPAPERFIRRIRAELDRSAGVILNSGGGGYVMLAPDGLEEWQVRHAQVTTASGPTDGSQAFLYRAFVAQHRAIAQTAQGGGDTMNFDLVLRPGDTVICMWQGGNPGDAATLNLTGIVTTRIAA
jgi:hypothetical protein